MFLYLSQALRPGLNNLARQDAGLHYLGLLYFGLFYLGLLSFPWFL